ncbi:MAG: adenylate/guanylate cyclase domain-containing protein [Candidatus Methylopumilus universalis]
MGLFKDKFKNFGLARASPVDAATNVPYKNINIRITISIIFLALIVPLFLGFIFYSYQNNYEIFKGNAKLLMLRANDGFVSNLTNLISPVANSVQVTARLIEDSPEVYRQEKMNNYLLANLITDPNIVSYTVVGSDGYLREIQRVSGGLPVGDRVTPEGANFVSWVMEKGRDQKIQSSFTFFKYNGDVVSRFDSPANYDPKSKSFYKEIRKKFDAGVTDEVVIEDPFLTPNSKQIVISTSYPLVLKESFQGIVSAQIMMKNISDFLLNNRVSRNSETYILDNTGNIIAYPSGTNIYANSQTSISLKKISSIEDSPASVAQKLRSESGQNEFEFKFPKNNQLYLAAYKEFPSSLGRPWQVLTVAPINDFLVEFESSNYKLFFGGLIAFLIVAILAFYFSKMISSPLELLAYEIQHLMEFKLEKDISISSKIFEIRLLSQSIRRLKNTLSAFTSYVPRDLVNDLLGSGKPIELGGESRYLTIFFSDLKDFSALSEITPSRELLLRVSSYLELMTYAIKEERGTIDKFIGDSVMAFWGAPLLEQNHAYHACVAAVKAQRRMKLLNEALIAEEKPPLIVRIGIHSDAVLVGNIGSSERLSYTVMGDGVNIASRLEGINKDYDTRICVSHSLFKEAGERLWVRPIDMISVKGRKGELLIYELIGIKDGSEETQISQREQMLCKATEKAFQLYISKNYADAKYAYQAIAHEFDDNLARIMEKKCHDKRELT